MYTQWSEAGVGPGRRSSRGRGGGSRGRSIAIPAASAHPPTMTTRVRPRPLRYPLRACLTCPQRVTVSGFFRTLLMATELRVSHLVGCSPRRTALTSWTSWSWRSVPAAARFTSEWTARLRLDCETAAATAPPGAIRKHVRSGCAGPHWHARVCEGSVGQLACRKFGDSTAATWRRCCLARESFCLSHTTTATFAPPLGLAPTHTPPFYTLTVPTAQHSPLSQNSPITSPECNLHTLHTVGLGQLRLLPCGLVPPSPSRYPHAHHQRPSWRGLARQTANAPPSRLIAGSLDAATLQWAAEPCMPSLDAPNVAPSSCLTGFCAPVIRQLLPLNPFHRVASRTRSTHLPLPLDLHFAIRLETGAGPAT
jgi:hypothetical protein